MSPRVRFAPSPNGLLHLGHAWSALLNHGAAQASGGTFLLRIENIDQTRARAVFEAAILEDLNWLSILPEGRPRRQSEHLDLYATALSRLEALGLIYPAFESRAQITAEADRRSAIGTWPRDPDGAPLYPFARTDLSDEERARRRAQGEPHVLRLDISAALAMVNRDLTWREAQNDPLAAPLEVAADPARWGDVILARRDVPASYHLCVVVDDAWQDISHVIRGADLYAATGLHRLLQTLLSLPEPIYHHHRLILDVRGRKLSKSAGSPSLRDLRMAGETPKSLRRKLGLG